MVEIAKELGIQDKHDRATANSYTWSLEEILSGDERKLVLLHFDDVLQEHITNQP